MKSWVTTRGLTDEQKAVVRRIHLDHLDEWHEPDEWRMRLASHGINAKVAIKTIGRFACVIVEG